MSNYRQPLPGFRPNDWPEYSRIQAGETTRATLVAHERETENRLLYVVRKGEPVEVREVAVREPVGFKAERS